MDTGKPLVGIIMGSDSDLPTMMETVKVLRKFAVPFELEVVSAHRSPARCHEYVSTARARGLRVIIAAAGGAAHLAGVAAAVTTLPVIAVPISATSLNGLDALLSMVQMPAGIPVATMATDKAGATNAGIFAVQILGTEDVRLAEQLAAYKEDLARGVAEKNARAQEQLK
jgi:phosphoribosylaminoimidazole carboxylase PurE protein